MRPSRYFAPMLLAVALAAPAPALQPPASSEQGSRLRDANVRESGATPSSAGVASVSGVTSPKGAPVPPSDGAPTAATGTIQYAFTPDDRADDMIVAAIARAREQVLVQAFSFTHRRIAEALIRARSRGVEVILIADYEQTYALETSVVHDIADAGVPVLLDAQHASAHNKIMVIDGGSADCAVISGSYNFTHAAQFRNAENVLILKGNPPLCAAYRRNWNQHKTHSLPYAR